MEIKHIFYNDSCFILKVVQFCDVDPVKIEKGVYVYEDCKVSQWMMSYKK